MVVKCFLLTKAHVFVTVITEFDIFQVHLCIITNGWFHHAAMRHMARGGKSLHLKMFL